MFFGLLKNASFRRVVYLVSGIVGYVDGFTFGNVGLFVLLIIFLGLVVYLLWFRKK